MSLEYNIKEFESISNVFWLKGFEKQLFAKKEQGKEKNSINTPTKYQRY